MVYGRKYKDYSKVKISSTKGGEQAKTFDEKCNNLTR
jgi:hypothetical protein